MFTANEKKLTSVSGYFAKEIEIHWVNLCCCIDIGKSVCGISGLKVCEVDLLENGSLETLAKLCQVKYGHSKILVYYKHFDAEMLTVGMILTKQDETDFSTWFISHTLQNFNLGRFSTSYQDSPNQKYYTDIITELFEEHLRNIAINDEWETTGKEYFFEVVDFFTSRNIKLEACLPAFPCKSQNTLKVGGDLPDKGEELSFRHLKFFIDKVNKLYPPGIKLWIVSDGHVFSDCSK